MEDKVRKETYRTIMICVDSYEQGEMTGRFYHVGRETKETPFQSLTQLLIGIEHSLNAKKCPQSFTAMRSFVPAAAPELERCMTENPRKGIAGNFLVKIFFRQHTSWQGSVVWEKGKSEQLFRSVLELILLMDSALTKGEEEQAG